MNNKYTNTFRLNQWWLPKASNILMIIFLSILLSSLSFEKSLLYIFPAILTILGIGSFGHLINDFFDLETDKKAGKKNSLQNKSFIQRIGLFILTLAVALIPWFVLPFDDFSIYLLIAEFALLIVYAVPPLRFKTKGFVAILTDSLYAYTIPALLSFHTFVLLSENFISIYIYIVIGVWQFFIGVHNILIHHLEDFENDIQSNTKTFAISLGKEKTRNFLLKIIFLLHISSFITFVFCIAYFSESIYIIFPFIYLAFYFFKIFKNKSYSSFLKSKNVNDLQQLNIHYHHFLIYWHLFLLLFINIKFAIILLLILVLFQNQYLIWLVTYLFSKLKKTLSFIVNYGIYYFRRFILFQSPEKARREHYTEYANIQKDQKTRKESINIAIVNKNLNKYTETFVDARKQALPYYIHTIYGNKIPDKSDRKTHLVSTNSSVLKYKGWQETFFNLEENHFNKKAFTAYLLNNNISLIMAEFGTTGVEIFELCKAIDIPMIVTFYGYDAFHKEVIENNKTLYLSMFDYASKVICVSKDIQNQLISLGAQKEKTIYLPCTFFPENFPYKDHSKNENIFLSIGRFAETKSPHLTILAFNEVLKEIPDAKLVMIGKDGGGELFEACHILVKALKIENKVDFKGILSPKDVLEEMNKSKVLVQHSLTTPLNGDKEGTPVAIMEAMATGLAIVSTKHAGIQEIIEKNVSGILVEEYDYLQMAKEMVKVCLDNKLNKKLGENASKSIRSNPLITENIQILAELIEEYRLR